MKLNKIMIYLLKLGITALLLVILFNCSQALAGGGVEDESPKVLKQGGVAKLDITGAKSLFIAKSTNGTYSLNKITDSNENGAQSVVYKDSQGNAVAYSGIPKYIDNVNSTWVVITYADSNGDITGSLLIRKNDGATFSLKYMPLHYADNEDKVFRNWKYIQTDRDGNLYYLSVKNTIIKIDTTNPDQGQYQFSNVNEQIDTFYGVDSTGDAYYLNTQSQLIQLTHDNKYKSSSVYTFDPHCGFYGLNEQFKYLYANNFDNDGYLSLGIMTYYNNQYQSSDHISTNMSDGAFKVSKSYYFKFNNRAFIIDTYYYQRYMIETLVAGETPHQLSNIANIIAGQSDNFYYVYSSSSGHNMLLKLNPQYPDNLPSQLNLDSSFEIRKMSVSRDNIINFVAIDSNNNTIIGKINGINNTYEEIANIPSDKEIIALQRIN